MDEEQLELKCRLCGVHESKTLVMVHIFKPENFLSKIHKILPISINEYDPLPKKMCYSCQFKVDDFNTFLDRCVKTQDLLKKELSWCDNKSEDNVVLAKQSAPLMEVIKDGAKNLNGCPSKRTKQPLNKQEKVQKVCSQKKVSRKTVEVSTLATITAKSDEKKGSKWSLDTSNSVSTPTPATETSSGNVSASVGVVSSTKYSPIVESSVTSTDSVEIPPPSSDHDTETYNELEANEEISEELNQSKREKLLLTLKKSTGNADSWSVPLASDNKRKNLNSKEHNHQQKLSSQQENINIETNETNVSIKNNDIDKPVINNSNDSHVMRESNKKEYNGLHQKKVNEHNRSVHKLSSSQSSYSQQNPVRSSDENTNNNDENTRKLPSYFILTEIPNNYTIYTCLHCEQSVVSHKAALSHQCEKLLKMKYEKDNSGDNSSKLLDSSNLSMDSSSLYMCEICNQSFSRHASLTAHLSVHTTHLSESDNEDTSDDIIFFGQKRKKKPKVIKKVITDQDG